jgi:VWFA-related protein
MDKVRHGKYPKQVLILITDGLDNVSTYSFAQVREELKASGVLVYSLNFAGAGGGGSPLGMEGQNILDYLSSVSGGRLFYQRFGRALTTSDATTAFDVIVQELRHQYTIAVTPNISSDDKKWHKLKIKLQPTNASGEIKHLSTRTREGFYLNHR